MLKKILVLTASLCLAAAAHAQVQISVNTDGALILAASGTNTLALGDTVRVGYIPAADLSLFESASSSYATLNADFEAIGEGNTNGGSLTETPTPSGVYLDVNGATSNSANTTIGGVVGTIGNVSLTYQPPGASSNIEGDPLYLWVFNTATPSTATQWGVFGGGASWDFPTSTFPGVANLTTSTANATPVFGKEITSGSNTGDFELAAVGAVPEPSSLATIGSIIVCGGAFAFRRRVRA